MCAIERESKIAKARLECMTNRLLLLLVTVFTEPLLTLVRCNLMSFTFFTAWHLSIFLLVFIQSLLCQSPKILILGLDGDF